MSSDDRLHRRGRYSREYLARQGPHYSNDEGFITTYHQGSQEKDIMDHREKVRTAIVEFIKSEEAVQNAKYVLEQAELGLRGQREELERQLKNYGFGKKLQYKDRVYGMVENNFDGNRTQELVIQEIQAERLD